ncbi:MAG: DUF1211 domain-containing protein [Hyphomicrobiales bacterium]|nr:DUF1211 domain-containing protein [Hyphomicrobiales bacterium]
MAFTAPGEHPGHGPDHDGSQQTERGFDAAMVHKREIDRLGAFTDGVIVISMTLLVLDIELPPGTDGKGDAALLDGLGQILPQISSYAISFLVIANYWVLHTLKFRGLARIDGPFVWMNIVFLLAIGSIPFVTSVLSDNHGTVATSLYAAVMAFVSASLAVMGIHAERRGLVEKPVVPRYPLQHVARSLITAAIFLGSIVIAQFNPTAAQWSWLLLVPASLIGRRLGSDDIARLGEENDV